MSGPYQITGQDSVNPVVIPANPVPIASKREGVEGVVESGIFNSQMVVKEKMQIDFCKR